MKVYKKEGKFYMEDNGNVIVIEPNKDNYLKLPTNSTNRVWVSGAKVEKANNQCIDYGNEIKQPKKIGPRTTQAKKLMDYATDEEKATIQRILEACKERKAKDKPAPKTELEKAQAKYEKALKELKELRAAQKEGK